MPGEKCQDCTLTTDCGSCVESLELARDKSKVPGTGSKKKVRKERWVTRNIKSVNTKVNKKLSETETDENSFGKENYKVMETREGNSNNVARKSPRYKRSPMAQIQPVSVARAVSEDDSIPTTLTTTTRLPLRRSSRRRKSKGSSKNHLVSVEFSSDGSEGSLSDLDDLSVSLDKLYLSAHNKVVSDDDDDAVIKPISASECLSSFLTDSEAGSADDELSVGELDSVELRIKKKSKKTCQKEKGLRRVVLEKQTMDKIVKPPNRRKNKSNIGVDLSQVYHGRNFIPKVSGEEEEMECDCSWVEKSNSSRIHEFTDVNEAEKEMMLMWNKCCAKYHGAGIKNVEDILEKFVESDFSKISEENLYRNFICHITTLQQTGLISMSNMVNTVIQLQKVCRQSQSSLLKRRTCNVYEDKRDTCIAELDSLSSLASDFSALQLQPVVGKEQMEKSVNQP